MCAYNHLSVFIISCNTRCRVDSPKLEDVRCLKAALAELWFIKNITCEDVNSEDMFHTVAPKALRMGRSFLHT